jgi:putative restriction endonuclease
MKKKSSQIRYGTPWTRDELILAFDLYCRIPFSKTKANNPHVIELANALNRTPASMARKLGNFGSLDPELQNRHISGLVHTSKLDKEIWQEFNEDWNGLVIQAKKLRDKQGPLAAPGEFDDLQLFLPAGESERDSVRKVRIHQAFFRAAVLSGYDERCCITGLRVSECLIASHIVPWSVDKQLRADPRNGLCLSATFDRLFDRGLIAINENLLVVVSRRLRNSGDLQVNNIICQYHGASIIKPQRFLPSPAHLAWHRLNVFRD